MSGRIEGKTEATPQKVYKLINNKLMQMGMSARTSALKEEILHYPRLDTILMVEEYIQEHSGEFNRQGLWEHLPKKVMYQTYRVILDYLENQGKITYDAEGWIVWTWNPELLAKYLARGDLRVR